MMHKYEHFCVFKSFLLHKLSPILLVSLDFWTNLLYFVAFNKLVNQL